MNTEEANALINEARSYLNRELQVNILNQKNIVDRTVLCKLVDSSSVSIGENGGPQRIQLFAKLEDLTDKNKIYTPSLKSVIEELKRLDALKK